MIRALILSIGLTVAPLAVQAEARMSQLMELLNLPAYVEITRSEGLREFPLLAEDFLGRAPDTVMTEQIRRAYDLGRMRETVRRVMRESLSDAEIDLVLLFVGSETGQKVADLELAARRAMSDEAVEEAAMDAWTRAPEQNPWLVSRIAEVIELSDLVDRNVTGALNSNMRFMQGLVDGGGLDISQAELLRNVWAQEPEIRAETETWLGAYLLLALKPLSEEEIEDYITFWKTGPGRALNAAMFDAFNQMYDGLSYATARTLALHMGSEEL